jgi:hypothetical protein
MLSSIALAVFLYTPPPPIRAANGLSKGYIALFTACQHGRFPPKAIPAFLPPATSSGLFLFLILQAIFI